MFFFISTKKTKKQTQVDEILIVIEFIYCAFALDHLQAASPWLPLILSAVSPQTRSTISDISCLLLPVCNCVSAFDHELVITQAYNHHSR